MTNLESAGKEALDLVEWLEQQPLNMDSALDAVRFLRRLAEKQHSLLNLAAERVRLANKEGDPILSAWLLDADATLRDAESPR